ncbi:unnamed protein product [Adineta ricciae]|uniref:Uncharacterized protein n=1 Tax=Adineta ricciae TaxID=249248 RepID=A0A815Q6C2_ADIRI|nr:unnamed protein product [Adineta ricciae]
MVAVVFSQPNPADSRLSPDPADSRLSPDSTGFRRSELKDETKYKGLYQKITGNIHLESWDILRAFPY